MDSVSTNNRITYTAANVGVLQAPDQIAKPDLFSAREADKLFCEMNRDIYSKQEKVSFSDKHKTTTPVKIVGLGTLATVLFFACKRFFKK